MKNKYEINGNLVTIYLKDRNNVERETYIDLKNLDRVNDYGGTFYATYRKDIDGYYCRITNYLGLEDKKPKYKLEYLHRIILGVNDKNVQTDHIDHNPLNNVESNLRMSTFKANSKNRIKANKNNKLGHRNICQIRDKLVVQLQVEGKNKVLGRFGIDELELAVEFAKKMRQEYYNE